MSTIRPLIEIAIEPKSKIDHERLMLALAELAAADNSFHFSTDPESGQTIIAGISESQLDAKLDVLKHSYKVDANVGAPQVAYLETITQAATEDYTYKSLNRTSGRFARVRIAVEPTEPGGGLVLDNEAISDLVPKEFVPGVEKGLSSVLRSGVLAGFPVVDVKVSLIASASHDRDSSATAFEIAARAALREALRKAEPVLLEPIMMVAVMAPEDCTDAAIRDLNARRGRVEGREQRDGVNLVTATVPLANMFGYHKALDSLAQGRASFEMQFAHYAVVPLLPNDGPCAPAMAMRA
jgi:elongation factor G